MRWSNDDSALARLVPAEVPIFGFAHSVDVVTALTRAGGVGVLGVTRDTPEEIEDHLQLIAEQAEGRPYGVDLVIPAGMPERDDRAAIEAQLPQGHRAFVETLRAKYGVPDDRLPGMRSRFVRSQDMADRQLEKVLASQAAVVALGVGTPPDAVRALKAAGKVVVSLVGAPRHAEKALEAGVDILVAQGTDAGGHTGTIGTFSLVPAIADMAGDVPVLAAGGVATGRHIAAALALGAAGVWTGTIWLATSEHSMPDAILRMLIQAGVDGTVISRADSGKTMRQLRSTWTEEWAAPGSPDPLGMPQQDILIGDLLGAVDRHAIEPLMHTPAGQSAGFITRVGTVDEVVAGLVAEADAVLNGGGAA